MQFVILQLCKICYNEKRLGDINMIFEYDENNLELQDVENGEAFKNILDLTSSKEMKSGIRFLWDGIELSQNDIKDGTILIMKFKVNKNAQSGKYPITLKCSDGDIVNADLDNVFLQIENGYITVENNN